MTAKAYVTLVVALSVLVVTAPVGLAANRASVQTPTADLVAVDGASITYHVRDMGGRFVTVHVPSSSAADIRTSRTDPRTVQGTVVSVAKRSNQMRVRTHEGQTLTLALAPAALASVRVGGPLTLVMPAAARAQSAPGFDARRAAVER